MLAATFFVHTLDDQKSSMLHALALVYAGLHYTD